MELLPKDVQRIVYFYIHHQTLSLIIDDINRLITCEAGVHTLVGYTNYCISCSYNNHGEYKRGIVKSNIKTALKLIFNK